jgi:hypothetical protein
VGFCHNLAIETTTRKAASDAEKNFISLLSCSASYDVLFDFILAAFLSLKGFFEVPKVRLPLTPWELSGESKMAMPIVRRPDVNRLSPR